MDFETVKKAAEDFIEPSNTIEIVDGLEFNQYNTIKRIMYYYLSQFLTGNYDDQGDRKYFFNIVKKAKDVFVKAIDFDTKNVNILTAAGSLPLRTWLFERDLKFWMKDQNFGKILNKIFDGVGLLGSSVVKVINNVPYMVDLRNFAMDQDADSLDKSSIIVETHEYTPLEFSRIAKKRGWKDWKSAIKDNKVTVYEGYGEDEDLNYRRIICADTGRKGGLILDDVKVDTHPYWEFHGSKIFGRWLGIGAIEPLFDPQIRINELTNQETKSSYWSALRIWQSRDRGIRRNLLTDVKNGEVLQIDDPLIQVDMTDRNLSFYESEFLRWMKQRDELSFSYEGMTGERLPSGTPLGSAQLMTMQAGSYFDQIQENVALDVKEFLYKVIIPGFQKNNSKEHYLRLAGEDLDKVNALLVAKELRKKQLMFFQKGRALVGPELEFIRGIITEKVKGQKEQLVKVIQDTYTDIKYKIDIVITGEQLDTRVRAATLFAALQALTTDPTLMVDPQKKKFFYRWLEMGGVSPIDLEAETVAPTMISGRAGGGVSRPVMPTTPIAGITQATI